MNKSIVSKEYLTLQKEIIKLQEQWRKEINPDSMKLNPNEEDLDSCIPISAVSEINFDFSLFKKWMRELENGLLKSNPQLEDQFSKINEIVDERTAMQWFDESFSVNFVYFSEFAKKHGLQEWLPPFLAESMLRPYLQVMAQQAQGSITHAKPGCGCPVCGEPVRLGQIEGKGQKVLHCPRCLAHWLDKKIACSHCGNEDHGTIEFLTIEGEASSQIHVCLKCKGYTKVIDTRQFISKPEVALLDLQTIHLDYIAQEKGYKAMVEKHSGINNN